MNDLFRLCSVDEEYELTLPLTQIRGECDPSSLALNECKLIHTLDPEGKQKFERGHDREFTSTSATEYDRVHARSVPLRTTPSVVPADTIFVTVRIPFEEPELLHHLLPEEDSGDEKEKSDDPAQHSNLHVLGCKDAKPYHKTFSLSRLISKQT